MSSAGLSGWVKSAIVIVLCVVVAIIVRPVLQGLVLLIVNLALAVALLFVIYVTLKKNRLLPSGTREVPDKPEGGFDSGRPSAAGEPEARAQLSPPDSERPDRRAERSADIDAELREIKRRLGKE